MPILHNAYNDAKTKLLRICCECCFVSAQHPLLGPLFITQGVPTAVGQGRAKAKIAGPFHEAL